MAIITSIVLAFLLLLVAGISKFEHSRGLQKALGFIWAAIARIAGGGFLKFGQILATRTDLFTDSFLRPLHALHEKTYAVPFSDLLRSLRPKTAAAIHLAFDRVIEVAEASGAVAQVHRAYVRHTGELVLIKVVHPEARICTFIDLLLFRTIAKKAGQHILLRYIPIFESARQICFHGILQYNLLREAEAQRNCYGMFAKSDIVIPKVSNALSTKEMFSMEYIPNLARIDSISNTEQRAKLAILALRTLFQLIFRFGIVHCDFHPGNIMVDGKQRLVVLDWGLVHYAKPLDKLLLAEFFLAVAVNDPAAGTDAILRSALSVPDKLDHEQLEEAVDRLFRETSGLMAGNFDLVSFIRQLFRIQSRFCIKSTPSFTMPILALLSFEGSLKSWGADTDFQREALPFILEALVQDE